MPLGWKVWTKQLSWPLLLLPGWRPLYSSLCISQGTFYSDQAVDTMWDRVMAHAMLASTGFKSIAVSRNQAKFQSPPVRTVKPGEAALRGGDEQPSLSRLFLTYPSFIDSRTSQISPSVFPPPCLLSLPLHLFPGSPLAISDCAF